MSEVIEFPKASDRRPALRRTSVRKHYSKGSNGPNMHMFLFRSYHLILKSDEADLVQDVCLDLDKAEKKLKAIQRRLKGVQEQGAAQVEVLTTAETKLTAAIVAALLSTPGHR